MASSLRDAARWRKLLVEKAVACGKPLRVYEKLSFLAIFAYDNYMFITTETIDKDVEDYAANLYEKTGGIEIVVLDCLGFLRHFLHLFHRLRMQFVKEYQKLVLAEPDSAVSHPLKEAFLALCQAVESVEVETNLDLETELDTPL
ncbi:MAG: hypothetical protein V7K92_25880 [Nostoc sp.]|uniref:hypothetical protein n=1 Tax=Nostoc sp. TaxID=1180 RepID=UPI002FF1AEF1